jgi:phosphoglycerol transferase MdoB-like AlkP superfamily enzyme
MAAKMEVVAGVTDVQNFFRIERLIQCMKRSIQAYLVDSRFRFLTMTFLIAIVMSFTTRVVLFVYSAQIADLTIFQAVGAILIGFFFDVMFAFFLVFPVTLFLSFLPERLVRKYWFNKAALVFLFLWNSALMFNAVAEFLFWDEFTTRFNFIAVDYLIYTTEVIGNIQQSYPVMWILAGIGVSSFVVTYFLRNLLLTKDYKVISMRQRMRLTFVYMMFPLVSLLFVESDLHNFSRNQYANDLAANGDYELFAAYRNNSLSYNQFYPRISDSIAHAIVKQATYGNDDSNSLLANLYEAKDPATLKELNVVLISVESLSADFMAHFGNGDHVTPFLDSLADRSILFTNLLATGTRTVRGLEALSLSIPPTPGQSIVRRPHNENLFTLASVFNNNGYESKFIYGGYAYFDNMSYFFSHNGYTVVDRTSLRRDEIDYENIWGVADENLFTLAIREIDQTITSGKLSFVHIMTTSNHRPYTYPSGRIDIPSHTSRKGAVKYTDYAIASFFRKAALKNWFQNTIFIITADHCASSAGKTELPVNKYRIPMLIFSPEHIAPAVEDKLMSQIDVAPTILGLLNVSYRKNRFYGHDIFRISPGEERAFISTYQSLGFIERDSMVILDPKRSPQVLVKNNRDFEKISVDHADKLKIVREAIAWYQSASNNFFNGNMRE